MVEGYLMLYLEITEDRQMITDQPLDDGQPHDVTITVSTSHVTLQVKQGGF